MRYLTRKVTLVVTCFAAAVAPLAAQAPSAQKPSFEVTSVKANKSGGGPLRIAVNGGRFVASNTNLRMLLQFAFRPPSGRRLRYMDIIGLPGWAESDRFDIEGVNGRPLSSRLDVLMRDMVQSLLEDRFQLKAHWDQREMATYNLVVAKNGTKLKLSEDQGPAEADDLIRDPRVTAGRGVVRTLGVNPSPSGTMLTLSGNALPIDTLGNALQSYAGRPIFNQTGLNGMFDLRLVFFLDAVTGNAAPQPASSDPPGPPLATAMEEQLGLKLESAKGPVEMIVIDSVQKPSEN